MTEPNKDLLKSLPAVDAIINSAEALSIIEEHGRSSAIAAVRRAINTARETILKGKNQPVSQGDIISSAISLLTNDMKPRLTRVINATGIILHTGLGRAYMPDAAREALAELTGFCNVQMDLSTGERIARETCIKELIHDLTGAEDVVLVNNNAGATMLTLKALADNREVVVSRGELIEIGGSFRLPEIMEQSGASLREVGSTNKTHLKDYKKAINDKTALLLKAHKSNYCIVGFTKEVGIEELADLGKEHNIPVADDLGCGAMVNLEQFGLEHEMTVQESLAAGADIVLFSTDKLIGGPQGGIIAGRSDLIKAIRSHPLYRALRVGKMTLAALEATLRLFKSPELLVEKHPIYQMLNKDSDTMKRQADELAALVTEAKPDWQLEVTEEPSHIGGGSLPTSSLPAYAIKIQGRSESTETISQQLRMAKIPVVAHIKDDAVFLNLRTIFPDDFQAIAEACRTN